MPIAARERDEANRAIRKKVCRRSDDWPLDRFAVVDRAWEGAVVVCIGGGPSVTAEALRAVQLSHARVIAVNDAYLIAPWADVCYFADSRWWQWHTAGLDKSWPWVRFSAEQVREHFKNFAGQKVSIENTGMQVADEEVFLLHNKGPDGLSDLQNGLHTGSNGGYQAINLAYLTGARRIVLLGYDMHFQGARSHSHNGHPLRSPEDVYTNYARKFSTMLPQLRQRGVEVFNCCADSAIAAFPKVSIEEALSGLG